MRNGFDVHRHHAGTGGDEVVDEAIGIVDHQVHVERAGGDALDGANDDRTDRDRRHEVSVHHINVNEIGAAALGGGDVTAQSGEVGGEDGGRDLDVPHGLTSSETVSLGATWNPPTGF